MFYQNAFGFHYFGFHDNFLQSKVISLASSHQLGELGPCIYVSQ
jgi:hypothetical protein